VRSEAKRCRGKNDACDHKRAGVEQISVLIIFSHFSLLSLGQ
jgi:hypothetical protein